MKPAAPVTRTRRSPQAVATVAGRVIVGENGTPNRVTADATPAAMKVATTAWNAGFSRHSGPQGRRRFVANPSGRTRSRAIPANEVVPPPAGGGLCRLKPAFQAGGAITARWPARGLALSQQLHGVPGGLRFAA